MVIRWKKSLKKETPKLKSYQNPGGKGCKCDKGDILRGKKRPYVFLSNLLKYYRWKFSLHIKINDISLHRLLILIFWLHISGKNGSVLKTIPDINRKKSIRIEQQNLMFSLRYFTKPKNYFLGQPVGYK